MSRFVFGFFSLVSERLDIGRGINLPFSHVLLIPPDATALPMEQKNRYGDYSRVVNNQSEGH